MFLTVNCIIQKYKTAISVMISPHVSDSFGTYPTFVDTHMVTDTSKTVYIFLQ